MLFPLLSFLSAQQRSVCCLINEYDDDDDDDVIRRHTHTVSFSHGCNAVRSGVKVIQGHHSCINNFRTTTVV